MDYWLKQTKDKPLFPELEWSRPENKRHAGKLLVVGGNLHGFAAPAESYGIAEKAGAGAVRILLPQAVAKIVENIVPEAQYAPSTKSSGGFSSQALAELLEAADWADHVLIAGDLGRNSETAVLLEKFLQESNTPVTLAQDAIDYVISAPQTVLNRPDTLLVLEQSQLQRLGTAAKSERAVTSSMDLMRLVEWLHEFTSNHTPYVAVKHQDHIAASVNGQVSTTKTEDENWHTKTAVHAAVWLMQHPAKPLESITTAIHVINNNPASKAGLI